MNVILLNRIFPDFLMTSSMPLARVNKGRHFLSKHQAMGMASVASGNTNTVYCRRVVNSQNSRAPSSTNQNLGCMVVPEQCRRTRTGRQLLKKCVPFHRQHPHKLTTSVTMTQRVITSLLTSRFSLLVQVIQPVMVREDKVSAHLRLPHQHIL